MVYRIKRRGILWIMLVLLIAAVAVMERSANTRIQRSGDYMKNLSFVVGNVSSEQRIECFTDEPEQTSYLFLPSYANMNDVKILFAGADRVVFAGEDKEITLKSGESIGGLAGGGDYRMRFCDRKGRELAQQRMVVMQSANLPAAFLETDSGSMEMLDADKKA